MVISRFVGDARRQDRLRAHGAVLRVQLALITPRLIVVQRVGLRGIQTTMADRAHEALDVERTVFEVDTTVQVGIDGRAAFRAQSIGRRVVLLHTVCALG